MEKRKRSEQTDPLPLKKVNSSEPAKKQRLIEDENDLLNFEFEETKASPKTKLVTFDQSASTFKVDETVVESEDVNFVDVTKTGNKKRKSSDELGTPAKRKNTMTNTKSSGFLNSRTYSTTKTVIDETQNIPASELSRSYSNIKRRALTVKPTPIFGSSASDVDESKIGNFKNLKTFKKQPLSLTTNRIIKTTRALTDYGLGSVITNTAVRVEERNVSNGRAEKEEDDPFCFVSQAL